MRRRVLTALTTLVWMCLVTVLLGGYCGGGVGVVGAVTTQKSVHYKIEVCEATLPSHVLIHAETRLVEDGFLTESLLQVCNLATATRLNTMFVGPFDVTQLILATQRLETPVQRVTSEEVLARPFSPPSAHFGTLIIDDIGSFGPRNQRRLCRWLEQGPGCPRIVSLARRPLVQAVADRTFMEALYYRLNTVYIDLTGART